MLDRRERLVEMMQQGLPLLVGLGLAEARIVIFHTFPFHEQQVEVGVLQTARHFGMNTAGRGPDDRQGLLDSLLELLSKAGLDRQEGVFANHRSDPAERWNPSIEQSASRQWVLLGVLDRVHPGVDVERLPEQVPFVISTAEVRVPGIADRLLML